MISSSESGSPGSYEVDRAYDEFRRRREAGEDLGIEEFAAGYSDVIRERLVILHEALEQSLAMWRFHQQKLSEVDARLERYLETFEDKSQGRELPKQKKQGPNDPRFDTVNVMYRLTGVELTSVDGIAGHAAVDRQNEQIGFQLMGYRKFGLVGFRA